MFQPALVRVLRFPRQPGCSQFTTKPTDPLAKFNQDEILESLKYCTNQVKTYDHENFYALSHIKGPARGATYTIHAFNLEIANALSRGSNTAAKSMRLHWWNETLDRIYKAERIDHPVCKSMAIAVRRFELQKAWFRRIIDARFSADEDPPATLEELEEYSEATRSTMLYLTLQCLGIKSVEADHAASHIGKAMGICVRIRGIPLHASQGRLLIPSSFIVGNNISEVQVSTGKSSEGLKDAVFEMANLAKNHNKHARQIKVPEGAAVSMLPAVGTERYLDELEKSDFDVFHPNLQVFVDKHSQRLQLKLKYKYIMGTF